MLRSCPAAVPALAFFLTSTLPLAGCNPAAPYPRSARDKEMFGPASMRLHPTFTAARDWTGDGRPDGVEAVVELQDSFGEPTRAAGNVLFEMYEFRPHFPDSRGKRLFDPWPRALNTRDEQAARWNRAMRAYAFQLPVDGFQPKRTYVLTAGFELNGGRLFDQIILEPQADTGGVALDCGALDEPSLEGRSLRAGNPGQGIVRRDTATMKSYTRHGAGARRRARRREPAERSAERRRVSHPTRYAPRGPAPLRRATGPPPRRYNTDST